MDERRVIRLTLPAELRYRDIAVRTVAAACRLLSRPRTAHGSVAGPRGQPAEGEELDLSDRFCADVVSAVSEIFNNVALHSYAEGSGEVSMQLDIARDHLTISLTDTGSAFDPADIPAPELEALPEGGMGIHIARACMDELDYTPGPPNTWRMTKYAPSAGRSRRLSRQI